jgi:Tol biopolymer transport system component
VKDDIELREILRATAEQAALPAVMPQLMRRKVALRRARTIGITLLSTVAILLGGLQGMRAITLDDAAPGQTVGQPDGAKPEVADLIDANIRDMRPGVAAPEIPYVIDLTTREMTPLPRAIIGSLATGKFDRFAVSPDGSSLAFVGDGVDGSPQIFIAGGDRTPRGGRTGLRQVTHDPRRATSPAWSPDGTMIAYEGNGGGDRPNIFVLDVATEESKQITHESRPCPCPLGPQFTPDGSSIIYTGGTDSSPVVRAVPVAGGKSTLLIGPGEGLTDAGNASLSPDGSLATFLAGGFPESDEIEHCGPCRFLANADGTDKRIITGWIASPAGAWSPDGTRIVLADDTDGVPPTIRVVDAATGEAATVAEGRMAIWVDDDTLLVDVR